LDADAKATLVYGPHDPSDAEAAIIDTAFRG
jgi:hypothetical protein